MIINNLINKETFDSLMEMYKRQGLKVTQKVQDKKFISFVVEGVQHIFVDDIKDYPIGLVSNSILNESATANKKPNYDPRKEVNESIQVVAKDFIKHHGKSPAGIGSWIFGIGSRKSDDWFEYKGKFQDGKKKAILKAEEAEVSKVFVMENISGEMNDVRFTITEGKKTYRVALLVEGKEVSVTNTITQGGAVNIGAKQVHDILIERSLSKPEYKHREDIVHAMKSKVSDFRKRYGDKAKSVMYGTATKLAKEDINEDEVDPNIGRKWMDRYGDEIEIDFLKDGKYYTLKNGRPGGGEIIPVDQLERTIKVDTSWYNKKLETDKAIADQEAADKAAKQAKDQEYSGIKGNSKLDTGRRIKALDKQLRLSSGEIVTVKQLIDREIKNGAKLEVHSFWNDRLGKSVPEEILISPDDTYRDQKNIGKIGLEYARQVLANTNEGITETEERPRLKFDTDEYRANRAKDREDVISAIESLKEYAKTNDWKQESNVSYTKRFETLSNTLEYNIVDRSIVALPPRLASRLDISLYYMIVEGDEYSDVRGERKITIDDVKNKSIGDLIDGHINESLEFWNNEIDRQDESIYQEKDTTFSLQKSVENQDTKPYTEEEGSTFESNGNFYDMNTILELADSIQEVEDFDVSTLEWVLDYDKARLDDLTSAEERVNGADKSVPILIYLDQSQPENEEWVVVDGIHRLAKAIIDGDKTIPAKILSDEIMDRAFISQEDETVTEAKTYTQRAPYKAVKVKDVNGNTYYKVQDKSLTFLSAELSKEDAAILVKTLNDVSEVQINEATKAFEVKYKTVDGDNTTEGTKVVNAPDQGKARTRFMEDNTELKGLQVISVNEVR